MLKSKSLYITMIIIGAGLFGTAIVGNFMFGMPKMVAGLCVGLGTVLLGVGLPKWIMKYCETTQPEMMKQNQIEFHDERNTMIRNRAKAKASDITQWYVMGTIYVSIIVEAPLWVTVVIVGVYVLQNVLFLVFNIKYQKEL